MLSEGPEKTDKGKYPPRQGWKHLKEKDDDPFVNSDSPKGEISTVSRSKEPADPSSDGPIRMIAKEINLQKFLLKFLLDPPDDLRQYF